VKYYSFPPDLRKGRGNAADFMLEGKKTPQMNYYINNDRLSGYGQEDGA